MDEGAAPWLRALLHQCQALLSGEEKEFRQALDWGRHTFPVRLARVAAVVVARISVASICSRSRVFVVTSVCVGARSKS